MIACSAYRNGALDYAERDLANHTVHRDRGHVHQLRRPRAEFQRNGSARRRTRPGWKVLRVLGNLLSLDGFEYETSEQVRGDALPPDIEPNCRMKSTRVLATAETRTAGERIADVPIYSSDAIVRRSAPSVQPAMRAGRRRELAPVAVVRVASGDTGTREAGRLHPRCSKSSSMRMLPTVSFTFRLRVRSTAALGRCSARSRWSAVDGHAERHAWELTKITAIVVPVLGLVAYLTLWERKLIGWFQFGVVQIESVRSDCFSRLPMASS